MSRAKAIPVISNLNQLQQYLATWRGVLRRNMRSSPPPPPPFNFQAVNGRGGITLSWKPVATLYGGRAGVNNATDSASNSRAQYGADGYEIDVSKSGDWVNDVFTIPIRDPRSTSYTFATPTGPQAYSFRVRATAGTEASPGNVKGINSGAVRHTSLDPSDNMTAPTTVRDMFTTDARRATVSRGRYAPTYRTNG